jgi:hypothetical protein
MTHAGAELLELLRADCGLEPEAARAFVERCTGLAFDPEARYGIGFPKDQPGKDWTRHQGLRIWLIGPGGPGPP